MSRYIYAVGDDLADFTEELARVGFGCNVFAGVSELVAAVKHARPSAVILSSPSVKMVSEVVAACGSRLVLVLDSAEDVALRLACARLGVAGYWTRPVCVDYVVEFIDQLHSCDVVGGVVALVSGNSARNHYHITTLSGHNFTVIEYTTAGAAVEGLTTHRVDVIIVDNYLDGVFSGVDLVQALRYGGANTATPVLLLSDLVAPDDRSRLIAHGLVHVLPKFTEGARLVAAVVGELEYGCAARSLLITDSLTGLYHRIAVSRLLSVTISQAARSGLPLSFAVLDLDYFAAVNAAWGYSEGNRVLADFAAVLRSTLRDSDLIGRWSGEEFAVVMVGTDVDQARVALKRVRSAWASQIRSAPGGQIYSVTWCAGLVAWRPGHRARSVIAATELALKSAKLQGRDQLVVGTI